MPRLSKPREEARKAIAARAQAGNDLAGKSDLAERTGGYEDWLYLFEDWRTSTATVLTSLYDERDISRQFTALTQTGDHGSGRLAFPYKKGALETGVRWLDGLIDRLELVVAAWPDASAMESLHPKILAKCRVLYEGGAYAEAVEKSFKLVRDQLRALTTYETGSDAFGKGHLYVEGSAAPHADGDFQEGVKFLAMAIDRFRNEKVHTADGDIDDPVRAYEYLRLSSLALHLLARARIKP